MVKGTTQQNCKKYWLPTLPTQGHLGLSICILEILCQIWLGFGSVDDGLSVEVGERICMQMAVNFVVEYETFLARNSIMMVVRKEAAQAPIRTVLYNALSQQLRGKMQCALCRSQQNHSYKENQKAEHFRKGGQPAGIYKNLSCPLRKLRHTRLEIILSD